MSNKVRESNIILPQRDISLDRIGHINSFCAPLKKVGITFFNYLKVYNDGSIVDLNNAPSMHESFYYKTTMYEEFEPIVNNDIFLDGFKLFQDDNKRFFNRMRELFNIDNVIAYIIRTKEYTEYWQYGSESGNKKIIQVYLNSTELLKQFTRYFIHEASELFNLAHQNKYKISFNSPVIETEIIPHQQEIIDLFKLFSGHNKAKLTSRETECLKLYMKGLSAKEVARMLKMSPRTAEKHIANLKQKTGLHKISQLLSNFNGLI